MKLDTLAADLFSHAPNVLLAVNFFFPCGLREMLEFKGFRELSTLFDKKSFKLLAFFAGNLYSLCNCPLVASATPNNNQIQR